MTARTWEHARAIAFASASPLRAETVPLMSSLERTLAQDVAALSDLPPFDTAAMDGWAVSGTGPWTVVATVLAGTSPEPLPAGRAVAIATGAPVPAGTTAVVRDEAGSLEDEVLRGDLTSGADIRPLGEECRAGDVLATRGTLINPAVAGLLAAAGHDTVRVVRVPRVRLLLLGDELLGSGVASGSRVRDSLGPSIPGWVARLGGQVVEVVRVADTLDDVTAALREAITDTDLVLTTGGTAAGPVDHVHRAIANHDGQVLVDGVTVRPGHPMMLARLPEDHSTMTIALPGNPQSAVVALLTLARPALNAMLGQPIAGLERVVTPEGLEAPDTESRLLLGVRGPEGFIPSRYAGSAMLRGLAGAEGFAVVTQGGVKPGDEVAWLPLP